MAVRCFYTDLDGTLLGRGASLFTDYEGRFSLSQARALQAIDRAGAEVVLMSGRRRAQVHEDARLIGHPSFIFEAGSGVVVDGDRVLVDDAVVGIMRVLEPHPLAQRTEVVAEVEGVGSVTSRPTRR